MQQPELLNDPKKSTKSGSFSHELLQQKLTVAEAEITRLVRELYELKNQKLTESQALLIAREQLESLRAAEFGPSSERYKKPVKEDEPKAPPAPRVRKPSERYPGVTIREQFIRHDSAPSCPCCGKWMRESGMWEESEQLTVIPKKFVIERIFQAKYRCSCQGAIVTAPAPPRIIPGSSYSDEMILDVALTKYCDLIPIERYAAMAARGGLKDLPPQSLIELTHGLADFVSAAYRRIQAGVLATRVLHADETPHNMLEGSDKKSWYLWGFSTPEHCFFECHDTRSGDVASDVLIKSQAQVLVTDVFSGYGKAVRVANDTRRAEGRPLIQNAYCNAHARRYFFKCFPQYRESKFYLDHFHEIYRLNDESRGSQDYPASGQPPPRVLELRAEMKIRFDAMRVRALEELPRYPEPSKYAKALRYYLENWDGLTLFLGNPDVPIDNNPQERLLRSHVVGRKTWYGTHSERGALTAAILFTLVESCKLNQLNPREYFGQLIYDLHHGNSVLTPHELKQVELANDAALAAAKAHATG